MSSTLYEDPDVEVEDDEYDDEEYDDAPVYVTHPRVVAGVTLIASLMLFSTLAGVTFAVISVIAPPDGDLVGVVWRDATAADYLSGPRLLITLAVAAVGTGLFWLATDR